MKKYRFVLIEVLIAIALLTLCAFPLVSESIFSQNMMRGKFFELELQREADHIFYDILNGELKFTDIGHHEKKMIDRRPLQIGIPGIGKRNYQPSYTLSHYAKKNHLSPYYKIHLEVFFKELKTTKKPLHFKYKFVGKKIEKPPSDLPLENTHTL